METKTTKNQRGEIRSNNGDSDSIGINNNAGSNNSPSVIKGWYVKPILNPIQKTMKRILENADLRTYKQRLNKIK